jgi:hypothetical protein
MRERPSDDMIDERAQAPLAAVKAESKGKQAAPWRQVQMATNKQSANKLAEIAGRLISRPAN